MEVPRGQKKRGNFSSLGFCKCRLKGQRVLIRTLSAEGTACFLEGTGPTHQVVPSAQSAPSPAGLSLCRNHLTEAGPEGRANGFVAFAIERPREQVTAQDDVARESRPTGCWGKQLGHGAQSNSILRLCLSAALSSGDYEEGTRDPKERRRKGGKEGRQEEGSTAAVLQAKRKVSGGSSEATKREQLLVTCTHPGGAVSQPLTAQTPAHAGQLCTRRSALTVS